MGVVHAWAAALATLDPEYLGRESSDRAASSRNNMPTLVLASRRSLPASSIRSLRLDSMIFSSATHL